ncbi:hypothetical protein [Clostridium gasigenes]|uniref:Zn-finger containing protein n=1 Tax=Clostridium gasigenes TaxID=94869 RepID=A0A1H0UBC0_9CLOT|nr:hypothetical protein [Clostridium gasigenes]MBU3090276.1 zinc-ribbon domain-containing protein [Clostridium gasigenes]MBU3102736.1 zinc-ribbon domain-containing protein [Clostridium gasigenes]MBU3106448.1 zinc-ribbon domain-containing protein [Clostridium gasigenes]MBU3131349.1 zinc-ribbon domain-containing protein [Clostridium gasigenes]MBU3134852.1 zinc-ribbon domain-containing protein [Clostridium gasigenes]
MNFFKNTYGFDMFSVFLILLSSIFSIWDFTKYLGLALLFFAIYRAFSKDIYRRKMELNKFTSYANKLLGKFGKKLPSSVPNLDLNSLSVAINQIKLSMAQKRKYKIIKCPSCKQKLRLPRKRGKIVVTCKKCSNKFDSRT